MSAWPVFSRDGSPGRAASLEGLYRVWRHHSSLPGFFGAVCRSRQCRRGEIKATARCLTEHQNDRQKQLRWHSFWNRQRTKGNDVTNVYSLSREEYGGIL